MPPRAVVALLLTVLALPQVHADPTVPPANADGALGCITIDFGPPPYAVIGDCDKFSGKVYVNGTDAGFVP